MQFRTVKDMRDLNSRSLKVDNYAQYSDPIELLQTLFKEFIPSTWYIYILFYIIYHSTYSIFFYSYLDSAVGTIINFIFTASHTEWYEAQTTNLYENEMYPVQSHRSKPIDQVPAPFSRQSRARPDFLHEGHNISGGYSAPLHWRARVYLLLLDTC